MSWIILEGLDRSGKSTVAEYYRKQGYDVVHMSAPDKKYLEPGYAGPSYLEEIVDMYGIYKGQDVVFDRSAYGELVWPEIFNRIPLLNADDLEYISQLEYHEDVEKYLMHDEDVEAHWKRCKDNNEPISRVQFVAAGHLYDKLENDYGFQRKQLGDFSALATEGEQKETQKKPNSKKKVSKNETKPSRNGGNSNNSGTDSKGGSPSESSGVGDVYEGELSISERLERANAISTILKGKIIKKSGDIYDDIEQDIRTFLESRIESLFYDGSREVFTEDEVNILKGVAKRIQEKME